MSEPAPNENQSAYAPLEHLPALCAGHQEAWRKFAEWAMPVIQHYGEARKVVEADVEDVSQDVLSAAARGIKEFRPNDDPDCLLHWLRRITGRKIVALRRRRRPKLSDPRRLDELPDPWTTDPDEDEPAPTSAARFEAMLQHVALEFPVPAWRAFLLIVYDHCTAAEAGAVVGMSAAAVRKAKSRIVKRLEELGHE